MTNSRLWQNLRSQVLRNPYRQHFNAKNKRLLSNKIADAERVIVEKFAS